MKTQFHRTLFVGLMLTALAMFLLVSMSVDPPRAEAQKSQATATPRGVKPQPTPAPQVKKPADVHIPHHRTGHLAKTKNLNELVAGGRNDPLAGNYDLVNWERIVTFWNGTDNRVNTKVYAEGITETLGIPTPKVKGTGTATPHVKDVATGYFMKDMPPLIVGASIQSDNNQMWLHLGSVSPDLNSFRSDLPWQEHTEFIEMKAAAIAGGDFGGEVEELAFGYQDMDNKILLMRYGFDGGTYSRGCSPPIATLTHALDSTKFDVATGDFDGDGYAEAVVAWADNGYTNLQVAIMGNAPGVNPSLTSAKANIFRGSFLPSISISAGDVDGDAKDEIILVEEFGSTNFPSFTVSVYKVTPNFGGIQSFGWYASNDHVWQISSAVGDFSLDGVDEIVVSAKAASNAQVYLYVFAFHYDEPSNQWQFLQKANLATGSYVSNFPRIAVGDVNRDVKAEIVSTFTTGNEHTNNIQVFEVNAPSSGDWSITSKGLYKDNSEQMVNDGGASVFVALGNLDQKQIRVGAPTHTLASNFLSTLAVIGMPPKHKDTVGGKTYDINPENCAVPPCTYVKYETEQKTTTKMSTTAKHTWDSSVEIGGKFEELKWSVTATYGAEFEKTTTAFTSTTFGAAVEANDDDAVVYAVQNLDVWEYPVLVDGSDVPQGYIVILFPQKADPNCTANCTGANIGIYTGRQVTSPYPPNHEPFDVLSYAMIPPDNISVTIKTGYQNHWSGNSWEEWVDWSDVKNDETKKTEHAGIGVEATAKPGFLAYATIKGSYDFKTASTNETSFETDTSIHLYALGIDSQYGYMVEPYFYWSKHGTLMLDYRVVPEAAWWTNTYNHPDPAFNLPWKDGSQGNQYKMMTREITWVQL